jgi:hypothetical protein
MVGGVAYQAGKKVERDREAPAPAAPAAATPPAGGLSDAAIAQLEELGQLKEAGVLTQEEFEVQKQQLLEI